MSFTLFKNSRETKKKPSFSFSLSQSYITLKMKPVNEMSYDNRKALAAFVPPEARNVRFTQWSSSSAPGGHDLHCFGGASIYDAERSGASGSCTVIPFQPGTTLTYIIDQKGMNRINSANAAAIETGSISNLTGTDISTGVDDRVSENGGGGDGEVASCTGPTTSTLNTSQSSANNGIKIVYYC
jgi:hypothetical protein